MSKDTKNWIVLTSGDRPINEIAEDLGAKGFRVSSVLDAIGQIVAETDDSQTCKKGLEVKGVADIVPMGSDIQLPGPDEDLSW